jgi:hypothetical protein
MDAGAAFERLIDAYVARTDVDRATAILKIAESPEGHDLLLQDREQAPVLANATPALDQEALDEIAAKRKEIEDLFDVGVRDVQRRSDEPLGEGEALERFIDTPTGKALYRALVALATEARS